MAGNTLSQQEILQYAIQHGIIDTAYVQEQIKMQKRTELLEKHPYKMWEGTDGKWYTYLPDEEKGRVLKKRRTRKEIEDIVVHYWGMEEKEEITLKRLFPVWLRYKEKHTDASSYIKRITTDWQTFYEWNTDFIQKPIAQFNKAELDEWAHSMIKEFNLTKKAYYNMSLILRQCLLYAVDKGDIKENVFAGVKINTKLFRRVKKKESETQVFQTDEVPAIVEDMLRRFKNNPKDTSPLAVLLDFEIGVRTGELVAIRTTDITGRYLHIQRQEIRKYEHVDEYKMKLVGFEVVEYTKSEDGDREIYLTDTAIRIINLIKAINEENGYRNKDNYLFVREIGKINAYSVQARILRGCEQIGIQTKTMHKVRKTYISSLIDSGLNINEVRKLAGHADERTTYANYCFNRQAGERTEKQIEQALNTPKVIKGNQNILDFPAKKISKSQ